MKKTTRDDYRIEVRPDLRYVRASTLTDHDKMLALRADIERAIERHVDDIAGTVVRFDVRHECSHCGLGWEVLSAEEAADPPSRADEHSVEGEPVCCTDAIAEFRAERGIPALADTTTGGC